MCFMFFKKTFQFGSWKSSSIFRTFVIQNPNKITNGNERIG